MTTQQHGTDYYVFEPIFKVTVPQEALRTEEEIRILGTPTTMNKRIDAALSRARTTTYMNIARMAEIHAQGHAVGVVNHADCKTIYGYVQDHLDAWVKRLSHTVNRPKAPYEDLYKLDQFAQAVFQHARWQYDQPDNMENSFMRQIDSLGLLGEFSIFQPSITARMRQEAIDKGEQADPGQREQLTDFFLRSQLKK